MITKVWENNKSGIIEPDIISNLTDTYIIEVDNIDKTFNILNNKNINYNVLKDDRIEISLEKGEIQDFMVLMASEDIDISDLEKKGC